MTNEEILSQLRLNYSSSENAKEEGVSKAFGHVAHSMGIVVLHSEKVNEYAVILPQRNLKGAPEEYTCLCVRNVSLNKAMWVLFDRISKWIATENKKSFELSHCVSYEQAKEILIRDGFEESDAD